jgi:hypothetical protein
VSLFQASRTAVVVSTCNQAPHNSLALLSMESTVATVSSREHMLARLEFQTPETWAQMEDHLPRRRAVQSPCQSQAMAFFSDLRVLSLPLWALCKIGLYNKETKRKIVIMNVWSRVIVCENHVSSTVSSRFHFMAFLKRSFA